METPSLMHRMSQFFSTVLQNSVLCYVLAGCILLKITNFQAEGAMKICITRTECSSSIHSAPFLVVQELTKSNYSCGTILIFQVNSTSSQRTLLHYAHKQNDVCKDVCAIDISTTPRYLQLTSSFPIPHHTSLPQTLKQKNLALAQVCSQQAYL